MDVIGRIKSIRGLVCEVQLAGERPAPKELLILADNPNVFLEVATYPDPYTARCINLAGASDVRRGASVISAKGTLSVPETSDVLGRVLNAYGVAIDNGKPIESKTRRSIYTVPETSTIFGLKQELLETGIKAIDFFTPFVKGRKIGIIGGAGVGKNRAYHGAYP